MSRTSVGRHPGVRLTVEPLERRDLPSGFPVQAFRLPAGTNFPGHLTLGGDGNVWYAEGVLDRIGVAHVVG